MGQAMARTLVVTLLIVVAPLQASAECAWVLWEKYETLHRSNAEFSRAPDWHIVRATKHESDCVRDADVRYAGWIKRWETSTGSRVTINRTDRSLDVSTGSHGKNEEVTRHSYLCLPDTIDPRGPKGAPR